MDFRDLRYLLVMSEEKNLSHAAEKLIVTQPTLSKTLVRLEERAGCPLFLRKQHGLELTEAGERFVAVARKVVRVKDDLDEEIRGIASGKSGKIHLGISFTFSQMLIPTVLPVFAEECPGVEVRLHHDTSAVLERMLTDSVVDVAVLIETRSNRDLFKEVLFYEQVLLAVSRENPLAKKGVLKDDEDFPYLVPELLADQRFILSQERMRLRETADKFFQIEGITPDVAVTTSSLNTAITLAAGNVGIAFVPTSWALADRRAKPPRYFSTAPSLAPWKVCIAMKKGKRKNALIESFVAIFKKCV